MDIGATRDVALPRGARLGEYIVAGEIASGGMGVVYLARREGELAAQPYAIKVVHDDLARRFPELGELLRQEARLASHIHHPHAVGVLEIGEHGDRPYAVMPYVEGGTLADLIATGAATAEVVAAVLIDALRGLHAAHVAEDDRGRPLRLVHRDVCPENVLVGVDGRARIADFGIAVAAAQTLDTERGSGRGKWAFMSPEQIRNEAVDRRSDVFAAGVTLHGALAGEPLFQGRSAAETMRNVLHMPVPRPSEVGAGSARVLDDVCLRALERDAEDRFSTAEEMAVALAGAMAASGGPASPEEVGARMREALGGTLAARREALEALAPRSSSPSSRALPLPPPNPRDSAAEKLLPEEVAALAAELDDDDDPDGPATSVYRAEEHGELEDIDIVFESAVEGRVAPDTVPDAAQRALVTGEVASPDRPTRELADAANAAAGSGAVGAISDESALAAGTPPSGSAAIEPEPDLDPEALVIPRSSLFARLGAGCQRLWAAMFRRG